MSLDELRKKRAFIRNNAQNVIDNMQVIADESLRVAQVAKNAGTLLDNLENEFEKQTGFNKTDCVFLFFATA